MDNVEPLEESVKIVLKSYPLGGRFLTKNVTDLSVSILPEVRDVSPETLVDYLKMISAVERGLREYADNIPTDELGPPIPPEIEAELDKMLAEARPNLDEYRSRRLQTESHIENFLRENQQKLGIKYVASGEYLKVQSD